MKPCQSRLQYGLATLHQYRGLSTCVLVLRQHGDLTIFRGFMQLPRKQLDSFDEILKRTTLF